MTMPRLMNCPHSDNGWCLDCVKSVNEKMESLLIKISILEGKLETAQFYLDKQNEELHWQNRGK